MSPAYSHLPTDPDELDELQQAYAEEIAAIGLEIEALAAYQLRLIEESHQLADHIRKQQESE